MLSLSPGQTVTNTTKGLFLFQTAALDCNTQVPSQLQSRMRQELGIPAIHTNNWALKTQENHFLSLCLPRSHGGAAKAQCCGLTGTSENSWRSCPQHSGINKGELGTGNTE